nr:hypothetical protein [Pantoea ananatis]
MYYNLFGCYDPDSGRFTQHDPIGLAGGINRSKKFDINNSSELKFLVYMSIKVCGYLAVYYQ